MGSQFVDLNGDGHLDYLTATFDGSPHVAWGAKDGFGAPERLLDTKGRRLLISSIWNYEKKQHVDESWAMPDGKATSERCISALAFDWDADGDFDLLLGSYENGHLYRQMNEGTAKEPKFNGKLIPIDAGPKRWAFSAKMTAPRLCDWDGDGDLDLVAGTFGETYTQEGEGGAVYLFLNEGKIGEPRFSSPIPLITPSKKGADAPTRPDAGLYPEVVDWDGDGDLDLIVGGYSMWSPPRPQLSEEDEKRAAALTAQVNELKAAAEALSQELDKALDTALGDLDANSEEGEARQQKVLDEFLPRLKASSTKVAKVSRELDALTGSPQRNSFVWFYERL